MKRITDKMAVMAQWEWREAMTQKRSAKPAKEMLWEATGRPRSDCEKALQRAADRGYLDYAVSLRTAWLTYKGLKLIGKEDQ